MTRAEERNYNQFNMDMAAAAVEAGIPLTILTHPSTKQVIEKHTDKLLYCRQTLQSDYLPAIYDDKVTAIRDNIGEHDVSFILDETPDRMGQINFLRR